MRIMSRRHPPRTKLERFLNDNNLKPAWVAREAGCSRQHLLRIRTGTMDPTRPVIRALRIAARKLLQRRVRAEELVDL